MKRRLRWLTSCGGVIVIALGAITVASLRTHTRYAPGFTEAAFEKVAAGATAEDVIAVLGEPLSRRPERSPERWCYGDRAVAEVEERKSWFLWSTHHFKLPMGPPCLVFDESGTVREVVRDREDRFRALAGKPKPDVLQAVGEPKYKDPAATSTVLYYSALDGDDGSYEVRSVVLDDQGRMIEKVAYTLWD
jgi:hypothetical protein